jgi:predicted RNase H-like nuclease (RuvC/YqgF family)
MKVDDAIKNIKMFHFKNLPRFKPELINLLKSLEAENKVYRNEQSGWVKEIERRQAKIRELEKLDLNVRGLMLENKALKKENKELKAEIEELEVYRDDAIDREGDIRDENDRIAEGLERSDLGPMTGYF